MSAVEIQSTIQTPPADSIEKEARVYIRPNLNRDFSAIMAMVLVVVTYHIMHPTLLFRSQFGRSFRGDSFQEAISLALLVAIGLTVESWRGLWRERHTPAGRLRIALVVGVLLYAAHNLLSIWNHSNLFFDYYDLDLLRNEDSEWIKTFRDENLLPPIKALNGMALFTGAALASMFYLWSPWNYRQPRFVLRTLGAITGIAWVIIGFVIQHPLYYRLEEIGYRFDTPLSHLIAVIGLAISILLLVFPRYFENDLYNRLRFAILVVLLLFLLHLIAVLGFEYNIFSRYYGVSQQTYDEKLVGDNYKMLITNRGFYNTIADALHAFDLNAIFAGVALISICYLMSPWERLPIYLSTLRQNLLPLGIAIIAIYLWGKAIEVFEIEEFLLPKPSVIWEVFKEEYPGFVASGWLTFQNAVLGFMAGCGAGILTGILFARFTRFSRAVLPLAIAANAVPIIAFAPITTNWFGVTSINSKVAIIAVLCYFPTLISTMRGLTSVQPIQLELMRSYAATEFEIFRALRIPTALPLVFSALKLCTTTAMIGAVVSEFFGGATTGLGYRIKDLAAGKFDFPGSWAAILVASLFGLSFYLLVSALERAAMPWYRSFREE